MTKKTGKDETLDLNKLRELLTSEEVKAVSRTVGGHVAVGLCIPLRDDFLSSDQESHKRTGKSLLDALIANALAFVREDITFGDYCSTRKGLLKSVDGLDMDERDRFTELMNAVMEVVRNVNWRV